MNNDHLYYSGPTERTNPVNEHESCERHIAGQMETIYNLEREIATLRAHLNEAFPWITEDDRAATRDLRRRIKSLLAGTFWER